MTDQSPGPQPGPATTAGDLAARQRSFVVDTVEDLVAGHVPGWRLPGTFGGHLVEPDVAADLVFTLGHLHDAGIRTVAGTPVPDAIATVLRRIDGAATHTFFSYRVAETLLRWGPFDGNPLLEAMTGDERRNVAVACDSSDWLSLLDESILPRNYAGVLARCELARFRLGLLDDDAVVGRLVERVRDVLSTNPLHTLDDSNHGVGRYDIYSADVWLFTEPLADRLGDLWSGGVDDALGLVQAVMSDDGTAVAWGRSTGSLGLALTVELSALAVATGRGDGAGAWLTRGARATAALADWFRDGVVTAHRYRSPYAYRGPFRRLQLTLDLLGKVAWAATALSEVDPALTGAPVGTAFADRDQLVRLDPDTAASVWTHRRHGRGLVVPFVGATRSDYLAAPRSPGCFEVPVDADLPCWVPLVISRGQRATASGVPESVEHAPDAVTARWGELQVGAELEPGPDTRTVPGSARVAYSVAGRTIRARWDLDLEHRPDAATFLVPARADRPLAVRATARAATEVHTDRVPVAGIAEWRSFWSEFDVVHQVDVEPTAHMALDLEVTPLLRVASTAFGHHYDRSLYGPLAGLVWERPSPWGPLGDAAVDPATVDLFHLHWPEWVAFDDLATHQGIVSDLQARGVPVVWTAHNLTPHEKRPDVYDGIYALWAAAATAVIHHSHTGAERFRQRYGTGPATRHVVIPHGHFAALWADAMPEDRASAESALGLEPCRLRIGIVGAPRQEKLVSEFLHGVAASTRDDVQVVCWSLTPDDEVPDDPRVVIAEPYQMADTARYATRLAACDVLAMPFHPDGEMLATGTVFDALGLALPVLRSDWSFLTEVLGDAGIPVGHTAASVAAALDALDDDTLARARAAAAVRRDALAWDLIAARTYTLFDDIVTTGG